MTPAARASDQIVEPPPGLDPVIAEFIAELARAAVRRERRNAAPQKLR